MVARAGSRLGVECMIRKIWRNASPLIECIVKIDRPLQADHIWKVNAFVAPNIGHKLVVKVVSVAALHRLDVSAELFVLLIEKVDVTRVERMAGTAKYRTRE
jgi:hypothetical protein